MSEEGRHESTWDPGVSDASCSMQGLGESWTTSISHMWHGNSEFRAPETCSSHIFFVAITFMVGPISSKDCDLLGSQCLIQSSKLLVAWLIMAHHGSFPQTKFTQIHQFPRKSTNFHHFPAIFPPVARQRRRHGGGPVCGKVPRWLEPQWSIQH